MGLVSPNDSKIDFLGRPYFWISCMIFRYHPEIHFYTHFWYYNSRKKFLDTKNISFSKADFYEATDFKLMLIRFDSKKEQILFLSGAKNSSWKKVDNEKANETHASLPTAWDLTEWYILSYYLIYNVYYTYQLLKII